jgi:hypothetical protein
MSYYNQRNYGHIPYPAPGYEQATLKSAGCGPCAAAMMAEQLTGQTHTPEQMAELARSVGARVSGGTDLRRLGSALCVRLGLRMETGSSKELLLDCLKKGGVAICNVSGDREGYTGLFSSGGHYVAAVGLTREGLVRVWDPNRYAGKFEGPGRKGRVQLDGNDVLVPAGGLLADCAEREPALYCFHRQVAAPSPWAEAAWQKAANRLVLDGTEPTAPLTREQLALVLERVGLL